MAVNSNFSDRSSEWQEEISLSHEVGKWHSSKKVRESLPERLVGWFAQQLQPLFESCPSIISGIVQVEVAEPRPLGSEVHYEITGNPLLDRCDSATSMRDRIEPHVISNHFLIRVQIPKPDSVTLRALTAFECSSSLVKNSNFLYDGQLWRSLRSSRPQFSRTDD